MSGSTRTRIFISYARKDASDLAKRLHADLQKHCLNVWLDAPHRKPITRTESLSSDR